MAPAPLPVAKMVRGRGVAEVAELLPRLFNLCPVAQSVAIRVALGLEAPDTEALMAEIRDEHALRLAVMLPMKLGLAPVACPRNAPERLPEALFGAQDLPETPNGFADFVARGAGIAPVLKAIRERFAPGEAVTDPLPLVTADAVFAQDALENSVAARHAGHPVMRAIETACGRGPYWRVVARVLDFQAAFERRLPAPCVIAPGRVVVPAARGLYAVHAEVSEGCVTGLTRRTPTDHMLSQNGALAQAFARLPAAKRGLAPVLLEVFDPCVPVRLEAQDA